MVEEIASQRRRRRPRHDGEGDQGHPGPSQNGDGQVAGAPPSGLGFLLGRSQTWQALGQPAQSDQQQDRGDDLDQHLGRGQIGRREPDEGQATDQTSAADQYNGGQAVILGLPGGGDGAGAADDPQQGEPQAGTLDGQSGLVKAQTGHAASQHRRQQTGQDDGPQTRLLTRGTEASHDPRRAVVEGPHDPVIGAGAVEAADHPGPFAGVDARAQHLVGRNAADQGEHAHHQRQAEAVPQGQTVIGHVRTQHGADSDGQDRADGDGRQDTDDDA
ncbi:hypothetical protein D3C86_1058810 [compost metagenome]